MLPPVSTLNFVTGCIFFQNAGNHMKTTRRHNPNDHNISFHYHKNLYFITMSSEILSSSRRYCWRF